MFDESFHRELTAWRRDIHQHPETAFEERRTSDMVAGRLEGWSAAELGAFADQLSRYNTSLEG